MRQHRQQSGTAWWGAHLALGQAAQAAQHVGCAVSVVLLAAAVLAHVVAAGPRQRHVLVDVCGAIRQEGAQLVIAARADGVACRAQGRGPSRLKS